MPVEIGQLVINARVVADTNIGSSVSSEIIGNQDKQHELVEVCVMEVLQILDDRKER